MACIREWGRMARADFELASTGENGVYRQPGLFPAGCDKSLQARFERHLCNVKRADDRGTVLIRKLAAKYTIPLNPSVIFFFGPWLGVSILIFWKLFVDRRIFPAVCCGTIRTKLFFVQ